MQSALIPISADEEIEVAVQAINIRPRGEHGGKLADVIIKVESLPIRLNGFYIAERENGYSVAGPNHREGGEWVHSTQLPSPVYELIRRAILDEIEAPAAVIIG